MTSRPNVLLVHCHDLGRFLGCYGVNTVSTPHLDGLAADGVIFRRAFCTAPQCSPSRASLFTGRYPHATGVMGLAHQGTWDMNADERHLAAELRAGGYRCELVGVHHESRRGPAAEVGRRLGFDYVDADTERHDGHSVTKRALDRLRELAPAGRPFYLQVGYWEPHRVPGPGEHGYTGFLGNDISPDTSLGISVPPYLVDDEGSRAEVAELQGAVRHVDGAVGALLDGLRALGLEESTIVIFTTDHGVALPRAKCSLYDPGIEIALLVRYPGRNWVGGRVITELVSNVDIVPTLLEAAGLPVSTRVHGRSLLDLLDGTATNPRDAVFAELTYHTYYDPTRCVRTKDHKLIVNFSSAPGFMDCSQSWLRRSTPVTLVSTPHVAHPLLELYELDGDPVELRNLATDDRLSGVRDDLLERLAVWMRETGDPLLDGAVPSPMHDQALTALRGSDR